jgi:flagellar protein FliO/FliZ
MDSLTLALRVVLSLAFVVALLWYIQRRVSRTQRGTRAGDPLTVISRRGLGQKSSVVVIETDGKRFLLGVTEQSVNVLHQSDAPQQRPTLAPSGENVFALKLAEASRAEGEQPAPGRHRRQAPTPPLQGSILSPGTWKQAREAIRKGLLG